jgi:hypothetical protein
MDRPIDRDALIALLKHQGFGVEEVDTANADRLRSYYVGDIGSGNIAWDVRDSRSHNVVKFCVVYCSVGRPPPYRGAIGRHGERASPLATS